MYAKYLSSVNITEEDIEKNFSRKVVLAEEVEKALPLEKDSPILDLGCGYGSFLNTLESRGFTTLYGVEIGAEQNVFLNSRGFKISQASIIDFLKEDKNKYYLITLFDVLEHFKKDEIVEMLPLLRERLHDEGRLIVKSPNGEAIVKGSIMYGDFTHETYFTKRSMIQLFGTFGFTDVKVYPSYPPSRKLRAKIAKALFKLIASLYKFVLFLDNPSSIKYFLPTQNITAIVKR